VLRERSWREGPWEALAGRGAASHVDLGGQAQEERLALDRLGLGLALGLGLGLGLGLANP